MVESTNSTTTSLGKRKGKISKSKGQGGNHSPDDISFLDDESDLSFDEDMDLSDTETTSSHTKKRNVAKGDPPPSVEEETDLDEMGETKVDKDGHLLEGREYKVLTFELPHRGRTLFMFSKDPAALLNFRDSFVFIKKNPKLVKVYVTDEEKSYLVETNKLRATFRTRDVSVVSARSVFKVFGHRVVKKGRRGKDDYYFTGDYDENEPVPDSDEDLQQNHQQQLQQHQQQQLLLQQDPLSQQLQHQQQWLDDGKGKALAAGPVLLNTNMLQAHPFESRSPVEPLNTLNWLHHAAISARDFSAQLQSYRQNNTTFYDIHTNAYQIPHTKQATTTFQLSPPPV